MYFKTHFQQCLLMCLSISLLCLFSVFFIENRSAESSRVALPCLVSRRIESRSVMSRRAAARRSYKTVFTLIKFQIKCNNADPPPLHTPPHPLTLLPTPLHSSNTSQRHFACVCLPLSLSHSCSLSTELKNRQQSKTKEEDKAEQEQRNSSSSNFEQKCQQQQSLHDSQHPLSLSLS